MGDFTQCLIIRRHLCFGISKFLRERVPDFGTKAVIGQTIGMECVAAVSSLYVGRKPRTREQAA